MRGGILPGRRAQMSEAAGKACSIFLFKGGKHNE